MMTKRFLTQLMFGGALLAACGDEAHEGTLRDRTSVLAAEDTLPSLDAAVGDASITSADAGADSSDAGTPADAGHVCDQLTYENTGKPFFKTYCAPCHRLPNPTFNDIDEVTIFRNRIQTRLFASPGAPMPPPNAPLQPPAAAKARLQQWLQCDPLD